MSSYLNSINLDHLSYTVCSTSYFGDKINIMHISRDERTPWINLKFAWHCKIFIWLINFILITKTFFTVDMCSQLVLILISPSKSADWGYNMNSHERFKVLWKKKSALYSVSAISNYEAYKHQRVHVKVCCLSVQFVCL